MDAKSERMRVLLAGEDDFQRQLIREYLEGFHRFDILEAQEAGLLLSLCQRPLSGISVVLLDMDWCRLDGIELILEIKRRDRTLPILGMTDHSVHPSKDPRLQGVSFLEFIPKPFAPHHLNRSVQAVLNAREVSGIEKKPGRKKAIQKNGAAKKDSSPSHRERCKHVHSPA